MSPTCLFKDTLSLWFFHVLADYSFLSCLLTPSYSQLPLTEGCPAYIGNFTAADESSHP